MSEQNVCDKCGVLESKTEFGLHELITGLWPISFPGAKANIGHLCSDCKKKLAQVLKDFFNEVPF